MITITERLRDWARRQPDARALTVVGAEGELTLSAAELAARVQRLAARLAADFAPGDRALLLLNNDEHYVCAFLACLEAGLIAVPAFPPESAREQHQERLAAIADDCAPTAILATRTLIEGRADGSFLRDATARMLAVDADLASPALPFVPHPAAADTVAFLQYTSGSTAAPKGVMVTHGNLLANAAAISASMGVRDDDVFVSWLPLYHDMGLIGGMLQPLYRNLAQVLMSPTWFLERPVRWLEAISRHRGTVSGGPDFAYRLCLERVRDAQLAGLDLSSWRVAFSGAEPVRADTLAEFGTRFAAARFDAAALYPCYGLAEATLIVSGGTRGAGVHIGRFDAAALAEGQALPAADGAPMVACGAAAADHAIAIVGADGAALPDGRVGEIEFAGASVAAGYWQRDDATRETFVESRGRRCLRTGDLGFIRDGRLYITGRRKDLIIVRGHKLYPQDLELAVERSVEAVRRGRVAAFAVPATGSAGEGEEGIGIAVEISRGLRKLIEPARIVAAIAQAIAEHCREPLAVCVLLEPGALPKTSSGKLQRSACRSGWQRRTLDAYAIFEQGLCVFGAGGESAEGSACVPAVAPFDAVAERLAQHWQALLGRTPHAEADFFVDGGNSLRAVQLAVRLADDLGLAEPPQGLVFAQPRFSALAAALRALPAQLAPAAALPQLARDGSLPLSAAQRRQFFLWQLARERCAAHVGGVLRLRGTVGAELFACLQAALDATVDRHESLRGRFALDAAGQPAAMPAAVGQGRAALIHVDARGLAPELALRRADEESVRLHEAPFDLERGPLLRAALISLPAAAEASAGELWLAIAVHHIASDGPSVQLLLDELAARLSGQDLAPLEAQYADVVEHQRAALAAGRRARDLAYWRNRLAADESSAPPVTRLAFDRAHPGSELALAAGRLDLDLGAERLFALRARAAALGCGLPALLLTAWQALLHRHLGQRDIRIGVPVTVREHRAAEPLIGLFVNTLVLKSDVAPGMTLAALAAQCRVALIEAQAHAALPFDELVDALRPERSLGINPLVQLSFNHLDEDYRAFERGTGLSVERAEFVQREVFYELTLETRLQRCAAGESLRAAFVYASPLFEPAGIAALTAQWLALVDALIADPARPIAAVELDAWADAAPVSVSGTTIAPDGLFVHERFARVAAERPDAIALVEGDTAIAYAQLERRAKLLAYGLHVRLEALKAIEGGRSHHAEPRIGLLMGRSADAIVAMLAVLMAGAAYVPLDPAYPAERLAGMVADARLALLLSDAAAMAGRPAVGVPQISIDELERTATPDFASVATTLGVRHAERLAYLIFTSGSTGRPKGVAVSHGALAMHMAAITPVYGLDAEQRELMFFSLSFDAAIEQWLGPLLVGGTLVLGAAEQLDPAGFAALVEAQRVNALHLPPAYLRLLAPLLRPGQVRRCYVGGEALAADDLAAARAAFGPQARIVNAYGPTETVITPTAWVDDGGALLAAQAPIGRPVGARRVHVLDAELRPVPRGAVGELWIGGAGLARGYAERPGATAERFIADPFAGLDAGAEPGARLYRTGDLVRWRARDAGDGQDAPQLEYLGRVDGQVKVRGFRIELGEIEAALRAQPGIADAVTIADGQRLLAFVAARDAEFGAAIRPDPAALRLALRARLPEHMLPARIHVLDTLPLTPNGKLDRAALARLPEAPPEPVSAVARPDSLQALLADVWARVLKLPTVAPHDNFFDLGGHSLLLIELHQALLARPEPGMAALQLVDLFRHPTVAALAAHLERARGAGPAASPAADAFTARAARQRSHLNARAAARSRA